MNTERIKKNNKEKSNIFEELKGNKQLPMILTIVMIGFLVLVENVNFSTGSGGNTQEEYEQAVAETKGQRTKSYNKSSEQETVKGGSELSSEVADSLQEYIKANGYRCDGIHRATALNFKNGFNIWCTVDTWNGLDHYHVLSSGAGWRVEMK